MKTHTKLPAHSASRHTVLCHNGNHGLPGMTARRASEGAECKRLHPTPSLARRAIMSTKFINYSDNALNPGSWLLASGSFFVKESPQ